MVNYSVILMQKKIYNILITGSGAPGAPGIIRSLQDNEELNLFLADANPNAYGSLLNFPFYKIPAALEPDFIDEVLKISLQDKIDLILPLVTKELNLFALHKNKFEEHNIQIVVSEISNLKIANHKIDLYKKLHENGIIVPDFLEVKRLDELEKFIDILSKNGKIPVTIKPAESNGSRGFRIIDSKIDNWDLFFNKKPNSTFINKNNLIEILSQKDFPPLLLSEYLPGMEYSVDCLAKNGETLIAVPRSRIRMVEGISVEGMVEKNEEIINYCKAIIKVLQLNGPIGIQVKGSEEGIYKILEINPRLQGSSVSLLGAGYNHSLASVQLFLHPAREFKIPEIKWGTRFLRYYNEIFDYKLIQ